MAVINYTVLSNAIRPSPLLVPPLHTHSYVLISQSETNKNGKRYKAFVEKKKHLSEIFLSSLFPQFFFIRCLFTRSIFVIFVLLFIFVRFYCWLYAYLRYTIVYILVPVSLSILATCHGERRMDLRPMSTGDGGASGVMRENHPTLGSENIKSDRMTDGLIDCFCPSTWILSMRKKYYFSQDPKS